jgi:ATP-dependent DNA ligase
MLATSVAAFDDPGTLFEVKWDGVRALTAVTKHARRTWGRDLVDYTDRYPELDALQAMPAGTILDGELVALRDGRPDFHALMARRHSRRPSRLPYRLEPAQYVVFDLLQLGTRSLLDRPLRERRAILHEHLPAVPCVSLCEGLGRRWQGLLRGGGRGRSRGRRRQAIDEPVRS